MNALTVNYWMTFCSVRLGFTNQWTSTVISAKYNLKARITLNIIFW